MIAGVLVCFGDDPGGGVGDAEVEDFSLLAHGVEGLHEFGDGGGEVPPVEVEDVDVGGLEFAEGGGEGDVEGFGAVADEGGLDDAVIAFVGGEAGGVFGCEDHLVAETGLGVEPFADPDFGLLVLVVVGCVDEVAALGMEVV